MIQVASLLVKLFVPIPSLKAGHIAGHKAVGPGCSSDFLLQPTVAILLDKAEVASDIPSKYARCVFMIPCLFLVQQ